MRIAVKSIISATVGGLMLLLIGAAIGRGCSSGVDDSARNADLLKQLSDLRVRHEGVKTIMNDEIDDLQELIDSKDEELGLQADLILELSDQPTQVKYVVKTVTVLQPINVPITVAVRDLPSERLTGFKSSDGKDIVVERMTSTDTDGDGIPDQVTFTPYDQKLFLDAALGVESSSFIVRMQSSYDGEPHPLPVEARVTRVGGETASKHRVVRPDLALQLGLLAGTDVMSREAVVGYAAGASMPWLHPTPALDILSPSVTLGTSYRPGGGEPSFIIRGGATIISYNVGGHGQSLLKDTWVGIDVGMATDLGLSGGLVLSTHM
jgi:hypothetical protein